MKFEKEYLNAFINIALGIMFIIFRTSVISAAITFLGVCAIILGVIDFMNKQTTLGAIKCICGVAVLLFGRIVISLAIVILGFALIAMGVFRIIETHDLMPVNATTTEKLISYAKPCVSVVAGICLMFNYGGVIEGLFIVVGILLIIDGTLSISLKSKK